MTVESAISVIRFTIYVLRSVKWVAVSALLSLVGPANQLLLPLAAFKCDAF